MQRFATPRGRSRNVIGRFDGAGRCLRVVMAHTDSMPAGPGAEDNASGLGVLSALAPRLRGRCDVWLVATGAEERLYTGSPDHLGARALARIVPRERLRYALSLDEVGTHARVPAALAGGAAPRRGVERASSAVPWQRDSGHRQLRPPRVRAGRDARRQARRARQPVPAHGLRHAGAACGSGAFRAALRACSGRCDEPAPRMAGVRIAELAPWRLRAWRDLDAWTLDGAPIALGEPWPDRTACTSSRTRR